MAQVIGTKKRLSLVFDDHSRFSFTRFLEPINDQKLYELAICLNAFQDVAPSKIVATYETVISR